MGSVELAILKTAQEGGYLEEIPEGEAEIAEEARFYVQKAEEAFQDRKFKKDKTVIAILNLRDQLNKASSINKTEDGKDIFGAPENEVWKSLPVPSDIKGDPTAMPIDFSELTAKEIMRLHAVYNGYFARARWMLANATNKLASATHLRDAEYRRSYAAAVNIASEKLTRDQYDINAKTDEEYLKLDERVRIFTEDVVSLKALTEIYSNNVDRLSREWTMRQDEEKKY